MPHLTSTGHHPGRGAPQRDPADTLAAPIDHPDGLRGLSPSGGATNAPDFHPTLRTLLGVASLLDEWEAHAGSTGDRMRLLLRTARLGHQQRTERKTPEQPWVCAPRRAAIAAKALEEIASLTPEETLERIQRACTHLVAETDGRPYMIDLMQATAARALDDMAGTPFTDAPTGEDRVTSQTARETV